MATQLLPSSTDATVSYDSDAETVTLEFPSELPVGDIVLSFQYTGVLNDQMRGFYSSKYTHPDHPGEDRYVAVTQFEVEYNSQDFQLYCNALWGEPVRGTMYQPYCNALWGEPVRGTMYQPYCNALWGDPVHGTMYRPMHSWFCFYPAARTAPSSLFGFVFSICLPLISLSSVDSAAMI